MFHKLFTSYPTAYVVHGYRVVVKMTTDAEPELPRAIALAWGVAAAPQRGPKRELSIERIVEAAMEIADESGLGAVSMAAVAARFDVTPMALYRYVPAKEDLLFLMWEFGLGLPPERTADADWRSALWVWARAQDVTFVEHPWMLDLPITGAPITPNAVAWSEAGASALDGTPLTGAQKLSVMLSLSGLVRWRAALQRSTTDVPAAVNGDQPHVFEALITEADFPAYRAALMEITADDDGVEFGMSALLDGIALAIAGNATPPPVRDDDAGVDPAVLSDPKYREAIKKRRAKESELRQARRDERQQLREARKRLPKD